ncbi:MAG TPA: hypothetical protein VMT89_03540, partial [Candidatus Acidoferrales bacterium]|nr:hypothetical protein [Candidatus Acidoferrales bacterium]
MKRWGAAVFGLTLATGLLAGCGGSDNGAPPAPAATSTQTPLPTATATPSPSPAPTIGPVITFFGLTRADFTLLQPTDQTPEGVPIYTRIGGSGFSIIVEGKPGPSGAALGDSTYTADLSGLPDLQIIASRNLGDGSSAVCDMTPPNSGGAPGISPPDFSATDATIRAINDFACRFRDGQGNPLGVQQADACVLFPSGDYDFVDSTSTLEFCGQIARSMTFPDGDTLLTVRLRDTSGYVGPSASLIVRVLPVPTPPPSATPTPVPTPVSSSGPIVTYFGVTRADGTLLEPIDFTDDNIPIYQRRGGFGFTLVVEGSPGSSGSPVSPSSFQSDLVTFPDLQVQVSRPLGNGSPAVCDVPDPRNPTPVLGGGVPGIDPPSFDLTQTNIDTVNDFACRFRDGAGNPLARSRSESCVLFPSGDYNFVDTGSTVQFCAAVDGVIAFQTGDTVVTARLRDVNGVVGLSSSIVIRV